MNLHSKAVGAISWAQRLQAKDQPALCRCNHAQGNYVGKDPVYRATFAAYLTSCAEIAHILIDIFHVYLIVFTHTNAFVPSYEELLSVLDVTSTQAAFNVANAVGFVDRSNLPPSEEIQSR